MRDDLLTVLDSRHREYVVSVIARMPGCDELTAHEAWGNALQKIWKEGFRETFKNVQHERSLLVALTKACALYLIWSRKKRAGVVEWGRDTGELCFSQFSYEDNEETGEVFDVEFQASVIAESDTSEGWGSWLDRVFMVLTPREEFVIRATVLGRLACCEAAQLWPGWSTNGQAAKAKMLALRKLRRLFEDGTLPMPDGTRLSEVLTMDEGAVVGEAA